MMLLGVNRADPVAICLSHRSGFLRRGSDVDLGARRIEVSDEDLVFLHKHIISNVSSPSDLDIFDCAHCGDGDALLKDESCAFCGLSSEPPDSQRSRLDVGLSNQDAGTHEGGSEVSFQDMSRDALEGGDE